MSIVWKNCDKKTSLILNEWLQGDENIKKFAMFDQTFTNEMFYYKKHKNIFPGEINNFVKVVYIDKKLIAYVVLNYGQYDGKKVLGINPIVINPKERNKGYAKIIIKDLIKNYKNIVPELHIVAANIDKKNIPSTNLFKSLNFKNISNGKDSFEQYEYFI